MFEALAAGTLAVALSACQTAPTDLRPWRPSDHTNIGESSGAALPRPGGAKAANAANQVSGEPTTTTRGLEEVTIASWRANCALCHGTMGRGDGPQAAMYMPRDLTDPEWQRSVTDEQLLVSIQKGKNKMPGFALPEQVASNLVALVRLLNRERVTRPPAAPAPSASAAAATTTSGLSSTAASAPPARAVAAPVVSGR
jgi:mono/diheme cytochrome c family protein